MKRINWLSFLIVIISCLAFTITACGETGVNETSDNNNTNGRDDDTYYTVTFDSQGGSAVESQRVKEGNPAIAPDSPTRNDFDFNGWYRSTSENAAQWIFATDRVNDNITLYAHWTAKQEKPVPTTTITFKKSGEGYIVTGDSGQATTIVIPETHEGLPVVGIGERAFAYSKHTSDILSVTIPDSVTTIENNAFYSRHELVTINIGENSKLTTIGNNVFSGCRALTAIFLPASVSEIGNSAFNNCGSLDIITVDAKNTHFSGEGNNLIELATHTLIRGSNTSVIPETVEKIGVAAFREATLATLTIPTSVTSIEKYAIQNSAIATINFLGTTEEWDGIAKDKYWNMGKENVKIVCSDTVESNHILVAFFSATGNTEKVAQWISASVEGTLYEIEPQDPYTAEDLDYTNSSARATAEQRNPDARPTISGSVENMESYDIIFLGYPIWHGQAPKIIYTFLESYKFSGKTIIPFCTSASSSMGSSASNLHSLTSGATWQNGMRFAASSTQDAVQSWLNGLVY